MAQNKLKAAQAAKNKPAPTRRSLKALAPYILGGITLLGGAGFWGVSAVRADLAEQDTSIVGQGIPTVVQVHDSACASCVVLRRETLAALAMIDESEINYRIANLTSDDGLAFASKYGASYTTLLLFDGEGALFNRIQGETPRATLETAFRALIAADDNS